MKSIRMIWIDCVCVRCFTLHVSNLVIMWISLFWPTCVDLHLQPFEDRILWPRGKFSYALYNTATQDEVTAELKSK